MSRYNTIIPNDVVNGEGVCTSFWVQGCPHRCPGCFNEETWDFEGGMEYSSDLKWELIKLIGANGIQRNFSVLGGEPLAAQNIEMTEEVITAVRAAFPHIKIYVWTGFLFKDLVNSTNEKIDSILSKINFLIDGTFDESKRDLSLKLRGSSNQNIWEHTNEGWEMITK